MKKISARSIALIGLAVIALLLTYLTMPSRPLGLVAETGLGRMLSFIEIPALMAGIALSGNVSQPEAVVTCVTLFFTYLVGLVFVYWLGLKLLRLMKK